MSIHYQVLLIIFSEVLHNYKCTDCKSCIEYISTEDRLLIFKCSKCYKNHNKKFNKDFIKGFAIYNKFILLLRRGVCPYEYIDSLQRFDETSLFNKKKKLYTGLNMKNITDVDYRRVNCKSI